MVHQLAGHDGDEERPAQLHAVSHARTRRAQHARRGGVDEGARPDGTLRAGLDARAPAVAAPRAWRRRNQSHHAAEHERPRGRGSGGEGSRRRRGEVPRVDQPQRRPHDVDLSAEDVSASDREGDARHHHGIRSAAKGNAAARRGRRLAGQRVVRRLRHEHARHAGSEDGQSHRVSAPHDQAGCAAGLARPRARQAGKHLDGHDVSGEPREVRSRNETFSDVGLAELQGP